MQLPKGSTYTTLSIVNQAGQLVHRTAVKAGTTPTKYNLPAQLAPGLYFIQLLGKEGAVTLKLEKE
ncbi:T9SS type A sorting domain-containing protein [Niastella vici]|uniref:T9SS type A sorting domain-containing protein n=1 Tax=Niastella vici TaxID=1703345 RepID=UPI0021CFEC88|nr:T9SS type A sorting domain-containing protein [Niastella vici]